MDNRHKRSKDGTTDRFREFLCCLPWKVEGPNSRSEKDEALEHKKQPFQGISP